MSRRNVIALHKTSEPKRECVPVRRRYERAERRDCPKMSFRKLVVCRYGFPRRINPASYSDMAVETEVPSDGCLVPVLAGLAVR
jgi:hypothetical protein